MLVTENDTGLSNVTGRSEIYDA